MADVFISYSKSRRAETVSLAAYLQGLGFSVWWDTDIVPGERFRDAINAELGRARAAIVIWTPASVKSDWVISEATRAHRRGILIGVHTKDVQLDDIPSPFDVRHTELVTDRAAIVSALARMGVTPAPGASSPGPAPARAKIRAPSRRTLVIGGAVAAVCAAGGGILSYRRSHALPNNPIRTIRGHEGSVACLAYTSDGHSLLSGSWDHTLRRWDIATGNQTGIYDGHENVVYCVAALPDGRHALSGGDDRVLRLWDLASPHPLRELKGHLGEIWSVAILPDGKSALSASLDGTMKLWNLEEEKAPETFQYDERILCATVVPGGKIAVSGAKEVLQSWNISDQTRILPFTGHLGDVKAVAALPNGREVLSGSDDMTLRLWELSSGRELHRFEEHKGKITTLAVSPDGRIALTGSDDRTAKLWDLDNRKLIGSFDGHTDAVESVAIAPDGRTAATGTKDRIIAVWDLTAAGSAAKR